MSKFQCQRIRDAIEVLEGTIMNIDHWRKPDWGDRQRRGFVALFRALIEVIIPEDDDTEVAGWITQSQQTHLELIGQLVSMTVHYALDQDPRRLHDSVMDWCPMIAGVLEETLETMSREPS